MAVGLSVGVATGAVVAGLGAAPVMAQAASSEAVVMTVAQFEFGGEAGRITQAPVLDFERMARFFHAYAACSTSCVSAAIAAPGVETIGEREVIGFITDEVTNGTGILLDGRSARERRLGYIATSVNVPLSLVSPANPYFGQILEALGARVEGDAFDFSGTLPLVVYDAGPTTNDAAALITALVEAGYPAERIKYYRGGMQVWAALGLSFEETQDE